MLLAAILWLVSATAPGAQQQGGESAGAQPRNEALPPSGPPPATFESDSQKPDPQLRERLETEEERIRRLEEQADDGFVPIDQLPREEQLPAAPMLIAAYIFVVAALFAYLLSLSRRLAGVKQEIARLELETKRTGRT